MKPPIVIFSNFAKASYSYTHSIRSNFTALFTNLNNDEHPDLLVPSSHIKNTNNGAICFYINDSKGAFKPTNMKTPWPTGNGFDVAEADFNGDRIADYYLCLIIQKRTVQLFDENA